MGLAVGASAVDLERVQVHPTAIVDPADPGARTKWLGPEALRGSGGVLLSAAGRRFVDELAKRSVVTAAIWALTPAERVRVNLVLGEDASAAFGLDTLGVYASKGLVTRLDGFAALATHLRTDETALRAEAAAYDDAAATGGADDFGKTVFPSVFGRRGCASDARSGADSGGSFHVFEVTDVATDSDEGMQLEGFMRFCADSGILTQTSAAALAELYTHALEGSYDPRLSDGEWQPVLTFAGFQVAMVRVAHFLWRSRAHADVCDRPWPTPLKGTPSRRYTSRMAADRARDPRARLALTRTEFPAPCPAPHSTRRERRPPNADPALHATDRALDQPEPPPVALPPRHRPRADARGRLARAAPAGRAHLDSRRPRRLLRAPTGAPAFRTGAWQPCECVLWQMASRAPLAAAAHAFAAHSSRVAASFPRPVFPPARLLPLPTAGAARRQVAP
jgi:hypothetical protein